MKIVVVPVAVYDPFFKQVRQGVEAAREAIGAGNAEVEWLDVQDADPKHQIEILAELRSRRVSAIVVCPVDPGLLREPIRACVDAGIPAATFCLDAPDSGRFYHIGQDLRQGGRLVGIISHVEALKEQIDARLEVTPGPRGSRVRFVVP